MTTREALRSAVAEAIAEHAIDFQGVPEGEHTSAEYVALAVLRAVVETLGVTREMIPEGTTPGPWLNEPDTLAGKVWVERRRALVGMEYVEPLFRVQGDRHDPKVLARKIADARLVSHAPDFSAALSALLDSVEDR